MGTSPQEAHTSTIIPQSATYARILLVGCWISAHKASESLFGCVGSSKSFIVRSFLRYRIKRNEEPNESCCRSSGIDIIKPCSIISAKLRYQACLCADVALKTQVSICVQSSCSIKEQLSKGPPIITLSFPSLTKTLATMNLTSITCSAPVRNKTKFLNTVMEAFGAAGLVHHGLRQDIWKVPFDSITKILAVSLPYTSRFTS
ncbi:hypothetical protein DL95DRAFT_413210 [Leptodontidium sp. 2 PMI_412]|nr:hypothetical protein DL95DRAFT_413210 [Leptodontidium sp. 2 PMI_412]